MDCVLMSTEVDMYINTMLPQTMNNLGNKQWIEWHQRLQKLNQQAVVEASDLKEEYVKESLVTYGKIPVLVHEVILIDLWKNKILPILLRFEPNPPNTLVAYSILYHEAVCVALLELVMYHANASEALGDNSADLLDYAYGAASQLLVFDQHESEPDERTQMEITKLKEDLTFEIGIRCLTILRYLAEYLDRLPLGVTVRIFTVNDIPVLFTQILLERPWIRNGKQYSGGRWLPWDGEVLNTVEAQIWLALRQLLLDPACSSHYDITGSTRSQLLKLQPLLSPVLLDQLSPLIELQHWLYCLAMNDQYSTPQKPVLLEIVLEIKANIWEECKGKWKKIAREQLPQIFCDDHNENIETAKCLNEAYNIDLLERFEEKHIPANSCEKCGKDAIKRCSRCKNIWYCSRHCQVDHWAQHKAQCLGA